MINAGFKFGNGPYLFLYPESWERPWTGQEGKPFQAASKRWSTNRKTCILEVTK